MYVMYLTQIIKITYLPTYLLIESVVLLITTEAGDVVEAAETLTLTCSSTAVSIDVSALVSGNTRPTQSNPSHCNAHRNHSNPPTAINKQSFGW